MFIEPIPTPLINNIIAKNKYPGMREIAKRFISADLVVAIL